MIQYLRLFPVNPYNYYFKFYVLITYVDANGHLLELIGRLRFHYDKDDTRTTIKYHCRIRYVFVHKDMNDSSLPFRRLLQR